MSDSKGSTFGLRLLGIMGGLALALSGCGDSTPPPTPAPKPAAEASKPAPAKPDAKGKTADPTANMDREELKAYKKKMREEGKSF
ncbi:hypothetical protein [Aquisphaera insulae]|uniref:hypothetical protein n=1 Tax=Aquisphaera insulae TaxID=2712864 RepID=UPI0013E9E717|nr:hypothetical protein [Aquisphaera insulae]